MVEQKIAANLHCNWSPGLIFEAFYIIFRDPFEWVLGPNLTENDPKPKLKFIFEFPSMSPSQHWKLDLYLRAKWDCWIFGAGGSVRCKILED